MQSIEPITAWFQKVSPTQMISFMNSETVIDIYLILRGRQTDWLTEIRVLS